eukprot:s4138_g4.t1
MERAASEPPAGKGLSAVNPFHSERVQRECIIEAHRPRDLPEQSPGSDLAPLRDYGRIGKGRGGQGSLSGRRACFVTPPSNRISGSDGEDAVCGAGTRQTEGKMPMENEVTVKSKGNLENSHDDVEGSSDDSLQRALEVEIVNQLREQNSQLLAELDRLRQAKSSPNSGDSSTKSWVEIPGEGMRDGRDDDGLDGRGWRTPRTGIDGGKDVRYTPNGTKVPDGTPPTHDRLVPPPPQYVPPVPPFPHVMHEDPMKLLDNYELMHESSTMSTMHVVDREWKSGVLRSKEPTPSEARNFWLEKEVEFLKTALPSMSQGNPFHKSEYWNGKYENSQVGGVTSKAAPPGFLAAICAGLSDPDLAEAISKAYPGDLPDRDRALQRSQKEYQDDRALHGMAHCAPTECPDGRALQGAVRGSQNECPDHRALSSSWHGSYPVYPDIRALQGDHGVCHGDRASNAPQTYLHPSGPYRSCHDPRHDGGGGVGGGLDQIPSSWESGGISGTKADLPELPAMASPLQFGDWVHLCGPVMRDLSNVTSRWWDLTTRQAKTHYEDWKQATPLQRVQIDPKIPDELNDKCYGRTEQRGVHLLLKAVGSEMQQTLVTDRQLTSTAILYRLYIRYQPGGPGEKSLILKELTQLHKSSTMAELASSLRSWRRHFGRAREVGPVLPDGTLLLRALEGAVQQVAREDAQAAFRLAQSRSVLRVDELPRLEAVWDFS